MVMDGVEAERQDTFCFLFGPSLRKYPKNMMKIANPLFVALLLAGAAWVPQLCWAEPNVLRASLEGEPSTLDWNAYRTPSDRFVLGFLMRGLLKYDSSGAIHCDLCKSYEVSPDGKVFEFELKPEEVWSDGVALEAQHFVDSFRRLLNPAHKLKGARDFQVIQGARQGPPGAMQSSVKPWDSRKPWDPAKLAVHAEGKQKLRIVLEGPSALFIHYLTTIASYPIRKEFLGTPRGKWNPDPEKTPFIGPYRLAEWSPGKYLVIEGSPSFKGTRPVYRVQFALGSHSEMVKQYLKARLDILANPTTEDLLKLTGNKLQVSPYWATRNLLINSKREPLKSLSFRKAMLLSLDRENLPSFLRNGERRVTGLVPPGLPGYRDLPLATADLEKAREERSRAVPGAKPVVLRLLLRDFEADKAVARWLEERLAKLQIQLKIQAVSEAPYYRALERGEFDLALNTWAFGIANPVEILRSFQTGALENWTGWTHVGFDSLLEQLLSESKPDEMLRWVDKLTQVLEIQEAIVIPLGYPTQPFLLGPHVTSFAVTPFGDPDLIRIQVHRK